MAGKQRPEIVFQFVHIILNSIASAALRAAQSDTPSADGEAKTPTAFPALYSRHFPVHSGTFFGDYNFPEKRPAGHEKRAGPEILLHLSIKHSRQ
jgi:hypothetical protein